jgi:hypothetical protein
VGLLDESLIRDRGGSQPPQQVPQNRPDRPE